MKFHFPSSLLRVISGGCLQNHRRPSQYISSTASFSSLLPSVKLDALLNQNLKIRGNDSSNNLTFDSSLYPRALVLHSLGKITSGLVNLGSEIRFRTGSIRFFSSQPEFPATSNRYESKAYEFIKLELVMQDESRYELKNLSDIAQMERGERTRDERKSEENRETKGSEASSLYSSVVMITLNRPKLLNALSEGMMREVVGACLELDRSKEIGAIVIAGAGNKAFAAGADISEMKSISLSEAIERDVCGGWVGLKAVKKPIIAAVNGYALGGGCELAMMCDILLVGESAVFGQPEVKLGIIPGMGGTQRLTRAVGKSRSMEMILSGESFMFAKEAVERGLASRLVHGDTEEVIKSAVHLGLQISRLSSPVVRMAKRMVNSAHELSLSEGLSKERENFHAAFGLKDKIEGMAAFMEKRPAEFKHE